MDIEAVIFDFGNVICEVHQKLILENLSEYTPKPVSELDRIFGESMDLRIRYDTGKVGTDEFFADLVKSMDLEMTKKDFIKACKEIFTPIQTTVDLIKGLKENYILGLLSNTNEIHYKYWIKPFEIYNLFDTVTLSYKVKAMKPDIRIYEDSLAKLNLRPEQCVFIDDLKENVKGANELGIKGIRYTSYNRLVSSLKKLGVNI